MIIVTFSDPEEQVVEKIKAVCWTMKRGKQRGYRQSDGRIVPTKVGNATRGKPRAGFASKSRPYKAISKRKHYLYTGIGDIMETKLARIAQLSRENPDMVFTSIGHLINKEMLKGCHEKMDGTKAVGIDGITKEEYSRKLEENLGNLVERLKTKSYKPKPARKVSYNPAAFSGSRHYITMRRAEEYENICYRNLAKNVMDQQKDFGCYPHAHANVETRGEAAFAARNCIDGILAN